MQTCLLKAGYFNHAVVAFFFNPTQVFFLLEIIISQPQEQGKLCALICWDILMLEYGYWEKQFLGLFINSLSRQVLSECWSWSEQSEDFGVCGVGTKMGRVITRVEVVHRLYGVSVNLSVHTFNKYHLRAHQVPSTVIGIGDMVWLR